mmetsp:Transcript_36606/g.97625  ORF Transcript_36606/g.97625 Transcript_36606/m.97625 type:complete len:282 (-) Transcript_36606:552-1397(-)
MPSASRTTCSISVVLACAASLPSDSCLMTSVPTAVLLMELLTASLSLIALASRSRHRSSTVLCNASMTSAFLISEKENSCRNLMRSSLKLDSTPRTDAVMLCWSSECIAWFFSSKLPSEALSFTSCSLRWSLLAICNKTSPSQPGSCVRSCMSLSSVTRLSIAARALPSFVNSSLCRRSDSSSALLLSLSCSASRITLSNERCNCSLILCCFASKSSINIVIRLSTFACCSLNALSRSLLMRGSSSATLSTSSVPKCRLPAFSNRSSSRFSNLASKPWDKL